MCSGFPTQSLLGSGGQFKGDVRNPGNAHTKKFDLKLKVFNQQPNISLLVEVIKIRHDQLAEFAEITSFDAKIVDPFSCSRCPLVTTCRNEFCDSTSI